MSIEVDNEVWRGRIDREVDQEDDNQSRRWHQQVILTSKKNNDFSNAPVILGFACDTGVARNQGRVGAKDGPDAIRKSLANLTCTNEFKLYDAGNVVCTGEALEEAQVTLADQIDFILSHNGFPVVLGGGHEVGWASFLGAQKYFQITQRKAKLGIVNFDAHFDLRNPSPLSSSGTPFRQCQQYCEKHALQFNYFVLGINPSTNTETLFDFASRKGVKWVTDTEMSDENLEEINHRLEIFVKQLDFLYLTICLDVFNAAYAPGVSAPAAMGTTPLTVIKLIRSIKGLCHSNNVELLLCDVAEMNPVYDRDGQTAKLAARLIYEMQLA